MQVYFYIHVPGKMLNLTCLCAKIKTLKIGHINRFIVFFSSIYALEKVELKVDLSCAGPPSPNALFFVNEVEVSFKNTRVFTSINMLEQSSIRQSKFKNTSINRMLLQPHSLD